jgi:hypothetical protein
MNIYPAAIDHVTRYGEIYERHGFKRENEVILMGMEM